MAGAELEDTPIPLNKFCIIPDCLLLTVAACTGMGVGAEGSNTNGVGLRKLSS